MSLIDFEKNKIDEWAKNNSNAYKFPCISNSEDSYYTEFDNSDNIRLYGFETLEDLKTQLTDMWMDEVVFKEIVMVCAVSAFKLEPEIREHTESFLKLERIPDFVYAF